MILSISWKNVWRNKTRSLVVVTAVSLGLFGGVFFGAFMLGMIQQRVSSAINNEVSHIQIHHPDYFANKEIKYAFQYKDVVDYANQQEGVTSVAVRTKIMAMANTAGNAGTGILVYGINPEQEKETTDIYNLIKEDGGTYFELDSRLPSIVISEKLAKKLNVVYYKITDKSIGLLKESNEDSKVLEKITGLKDKRFRREKDFIKAVEDSLGFELSQKQLYNFTHATLEYKLRSKIIVSFVGTTGDLVQSAFRISGIYKTSNTMFDELSVFVEKQELDALAVINPNEAHEIAILCNDFESSTRVNDNIKAKFKNLSVQEWTDLQPDLKMTTEYMNISFYILTIFILLALGFGIVNTMLMAILERIKELGMLMAVGMNKVRVFNMIMLESIFLTITGGIVGIILSTVVVMILGKTGMDLTALYGDGLEAVGYSAIIYPEISMKYLIGTTVMVIATGLIASIYPARKAIKLNPAEAVRTDN
jgi:ABC-type lipoprotein release transport system permease subunit